MTSARATLASFTIAEAPAVTTAAKSTAKKQAPVLLWVIGGIVALGLLAGAAVWGLRKRRAGSSSNTSNPSAPAPPAEPSDTTNTTEPPQSE